MTSWRIIVFAMAFLSAQAWAQDAPLPVTEPVSNGAAAAATGVAEVQNELARRSQILDARQQTLDEAERLFADRERVLNERERQLNTREQLAIEREQVLSTQIPFTPQPAPTEPDNFRPGLDGRTFQPGVGMNFFPGVLDTDNNFISR